MASVFKSPPGAPTWTILYTDENGKRRKRKGYSKKQDTIRYAILLEETARKLRDGILDDTLRRLAIRPTLTKRGYIYVIADAGFNAIKVGFARNVRGRLPDLQAGNPRKLRLIGYWPGTEEEERALHKKLRQRRESFHIHREWYRSDPSLLDELVSQKGFVRVARKPKAKGNRQPLYDPSPQRENVR
jgi:hypothetical protein